MLFGYPKRKPYVTVVIEDRHDRRMPRRLLLGMALMLATFASSGQNRVPAFEINEKLGRGINMGNAFEAPSETEWGNPWKPEYFRMMRDLGFNHVRLPV